MLFTVKLISYCGIEDTTLWILTWRHSIFKSCLRNVLKAKIKVANFKAGSGEIAMI